MFYRSDNTLSNSRRFLMADERGSIVSQAPNDGSASTIISYDEFGIPSSTPPAHGYTGQLWLPALGMWYYKARVYSPTLGRFMQTDPIGYGDGMNWYNYVGGDPVNRSDPTGMTSTINGCTFHQIDTAAYRDANNNYRRDPDEPWLPGTQQLELTDVVCTGTGLAGYYESRGAGRSGDYGGGEQIVVTATKYSPSLARSAYPGFSYCNNPRYGVYNKYYQSGRIVSGKGPTGDFGEDFSTITRLNGLQVDGPIIDRRRYSLVRYSPVAIYLGGGWWGSHNYASNFTSIYNDGFVLRLNETTGAIRMDLPAGALLPNGYRLEYKETCHY